MHLALTISVDGELLSKGDTLPPQCGRDLLKSSQGASDRRGPPQPGPTNELLWVKSLHAASAFPPGGFASSDGGAFTTPVV
jgi:hypothetical protein